MEGRLIGRAIVCCAPKNTFSTQTVVAVRANTNTGKGAFGCIFKTRVIFGRIRPAGSQKSGMRKDFYRTIAQAEVTFLRHGGRSF